MHKHKHTCANKCDAFGLVYNLAVGNKFIHNHLRISPYQYARVVCRTSSARAYLLAVSVYYSKMVSNIFCCFWYFFIWQYRQFNSSYISLLFNIFNPYRRLSHRISIYKFVYIYIYIYQNNSIHSIYESPSSGMAGNCVCFGFFFLLCFLLLFFLYSLSVCMFCYELTVATVRHSHSGQIVSNDRT